MNLHCPRSAELEPQGLYLSHLQALKQQAPSGLYHFSNFTVLFKRLTSFYLMCKDILPACVSAYPVCSVYGDQKPSLILGIGSRSSEEAASAPNHWAILQSLRSVYSETGVSPCIPGWSGAHYAAQSGHNSFAPAS